MKDNVIDLVLLLSVISNTIVYIKQFISRKRARCIFFKYLHYRYVMRLHIMPYYCFGLAIKVFTAITLINRFPLLIENFENQTTKYSVF